MRSRTMMSRGMARRYCKMPKVSSLRTDNEYSGHRFGILGTLSALDAGRPIILGSRKQQLVLAVLLGNANCLVSVETLIAALWDDCPPRTARKNLQVYISTLRHLLGDFSGPHGRITHQIGGYVLAAEPEELDWLLFEQQVRDSQQYRPWSVALARSLAAALRLRRGPVLDGMRGNPVLDAIAERLESRVMTTFEDWAEATVTAGGACDAIEQITHLALRHPFRERLRMVQMTALNQIGRRTEAMAVFDELRRSLASEFGLAPSAALMAQYQALLRDADQPQAARHDATFSLLPRDAAAFTGRQAQIATVAAAFAAGERLAVLAGTVGIGKSTLAVRVAHEVRDQFPDGCFFARLRASDGAERPARHVLAQLCWPANPGLAGRGGDAWSWRRWLAGHRALVILDDARRESAVRPLLPESGESAVIVTSRARLTGLGPACRVALPPLEADEAVRLLERIIGRDRVNRDPDSARRIVTAVGLLPLAVRVAGDKLAALGHVPLREYLGRVDTAPELLDELAAGDITVRAQLAAAVADLPRLARTALPQLGMLDRPMFTLHDAASVLDLGAVDVLRVLETLLEASIVTTPDTEVMAHSVVYAMPVLVHAYARELAAAGRSSAGPSAPSAGSAIPAAAAMMSAARELPPALASLSPSAAAWSRSSRSGEAELSVADQAAPSRPGR
jgi:DNA-binding SARP family transcriptional activator